MPRLKLQRAVDAFILEVIEDLVVGKPVAIRGFGTLKATVYKTGKRLHPKTGAVIENLTAVKVLLKTSATVKDRIRRAQCPETSSSSEASSPS